MSESVTLASSSSTVKVWQASTMGLELEWATDSHEGKPIHALEWNHNGEFIISGGEYGRLVMEHGKTGVSLASLDVPLIEPDARASVLGVSLSRGSRFLCCGGTDCLVSVFDLKEKKRIRTFKGHRDTVTSVAFTAKEDHVASGSLSGEILLHSMIRDSSVATFKPKLFSVTSSIDYAVSKIAFSPHSVYSLVSAMESGGVTLWDVARRIESYSFVAAHTAPTTSIAFSPLNKLLFCTGGLDKRVCFYDSQDKKVVKRIPVPSPIQSVCFMNDGTHLFVGTTKGQIILYDLRGGKDPLFTHAAFAKGSVFDMKIRPNKSAPSSPPKRTATSRRTAKKEDNPQGGDDLESKFPSVQKLRDTLKKAQEQQDSSISTSTSTAASEGRLGMSVHGESDSKVGMPSTFSRISGAGKSFGIESESGSGGLIEEKKWEKDPVRSSSQSDSLLSPSSKTMPTTRLTIATGGSGTRVPTVGIGAYPHDTSTAIFSPLVSKDARSRVPRSTMVSHTSYDGPDETTIDRVSSGEPYSRTVSKPDESVSHRPVIEPISSVFSPLRDIRDRRQDAVEESDKKIGSSGTESPIPQNLEVGVAMAMYSRHGGDGLDVVAGSLPTEGEVDIDYEEARREDASSRTIEQYGGASKTMPVNLFPDLTHGSSTPGTSASTRDKTKSPMPSPSEASVSSIRTPSALPSDVEDIISKISSPHLHPQKGHSGGDHAIGRRVASAPDRGGGSADFQSKVFRSMIQSSLDELQESVHRDVQGVHLEVLRQFQGMKKDMESEIRELRSFIEPLVWEIQRLREENDRLKSVF
eukprot:TRINITY_DN2469_c0_g1_i2.p1 TRINITY_DN2469_c0_g1~~TRINITY_DN2469_c0_g1_i2.p1  ORF type:complete len:806 (+),score=188.10 TRINITY_DN2469_c0_g1_i2:115-2532(+)